MLKLTTELLFFYFKNKYGQKICIIKHGNRQDYCNYERQEGRRSGCPTLPRERGARPPGQGSSRCSGRPVRGARSAAARPREPTAQRPPSMGSAQHSGLPARGARGAAAARPGALQEGRGYFGAMLASPMRHAGSRALALVDGNPVQGTP